MPCRASCQYRRSLPEGDPAVIGRHEVVDENPYAGPPQPLLRQGQESRKVQIRR